MNSFLSEKIPFFTYFLILALGYIRMENIQQMDVQRPIETNVDQKETNQNTHIFISSKQTIQGFVCR